MIQPKIQEVYFPIEDINSDDFTPHILCHESGEYIQNLEKQKLITFTPEEFEQFKREFGKELLENVIKNVTTKCLNQDVTGSSCCSECEYHIVNKESILSTLDDYLLNNKI